MNKALIQFVFLIVLAITIIVINIILKDSKQIDSENVRVLYTDCQLDQNDCSLKIAEKIIVVSTEGEIKPLSRFSVLLSDQSSVIEIAEVNFTMKQMDMGTNKALFKRFNRENWKADVIIPVCTTGRNDWNLRIKIQAAEKLYQFDLSLQI